MNDLAENTFAGYQAILGPFLMMTSCATLVWGLQNRFSKVVHAIRTLSYQGTRENIDYSHSLDIQIKWLKNRSLLLRNSITGLYTAMGCYLVTVMMLTLSLVTQSNISNLTVAVFMLGLLLTTASIFISIIETSRSFDSLEEDVESHKND
ncbi:DUF2721 domain-containing protein [Puniceicoccaceae bacterium K14]|nr:DUF2721 domain-containing protein [Puniceicoccaceae bacterium K14]